MDVGGFWRQGVLEDGGCLRGAGYKRGGWIPRMRTMWITGSRTRVLEPRCSWGSRRERPQEEKVPQQQVW